MIKDGAIGETISHYKILEKLGQGGMGVVYRAQDTKLKREVAIKFLPHQIAANEEQRERFKIEAQAAAALNHPNIATIYAIEEVDDEIFIVMEYIEGKDLKRIVHSAIPNPPSAINYAIQIASGLQTAHEKGVIHRDIKSANIMITDKGQVKIMDFGLAKVHGGGLVTRIGTTLGTASYMSPEQAQGKDVDHRTDIWAFGVVLYEMVTGQLPFTGDFEQAVIYSILNEEPNAVSELRPDLPEFLERVVTKALVKSPDQRYTEMAAVLQDLRSHETNKASGVDLGSVDVKVDSGTSRRTRRLLYSSVAALLIIVAAVLFWDRGEITRPSTAIRIAVLPLQNLGPAEEEYFSDGLTGEITSKLSTISGLAVIARSSAVQYKNTAKSLEQIGEELNVSYVLEGTLQWAESSQGDKRIRVNPELIRIADATQVWSQPYEAKFSNAFDLQADIAAKVADALNITLVASEQQLLRGELTSNPEAYDIYLRARQYSEDIDNERGVRIAEQLLLKAIELDSNFSAAYAELSSVQSNMYWTYFEHSEEILVKSKRNAKRALVQDPNLAVAHVAMGNYHYHGRLDYDAALQEYQEAIRLQPNNTEANNGVGFVLRRQGKMQQAVEHFKRALDLDPRSYSTVFSVGETYVLLREYEQAIPFLERAMLLAPEAVTPYYYQAWSYLLSHGDVKAARTAIESALQRKVGEGNTYFTYTLLMCDVFEGKLVTALGRLEGVGEIDNQFMLKPEELLAARIYGSMNDQPQAAKHYQAARQRLENYKKKHPDDSRLYSSLGLAYAGLGRKADAIREGKRGVELLPISEEAWRGSYRLLDLAQIYTMAGESGLALDALDELLGRPTDAISVSLLKTDPVWEALRGHPRFPQLLKKWSIGGI